MDLDRFKKTADEVLAKEKAEKQWADSVLANTTEYWKQYTLNLVNSIQDTYLDNIINGLVQTNPKSTSFTLRQNIYFPSFLNNGLRVRYNVLENYNIDLWKNVESTYNVPNGNILDKHRSTYQDYTSSLVLSPTVAKKYVNEVLEPAIVKRLKAYGVEIIATQDESKYSHIVLSIHIKNPIVEYQ